MTVVAGHEVPGQLLACTAVDPETFYGPADSQPDGPLYAWERRALAVCASCPVRAQCLAEAMTWAVRDQHGVIGGMTAGQRQAALREAGARPSRSYISLRPRQRRTAVA